jgi:hypothetical protein
VLAVAVLFLGSAGWFAYQRGVLLKDSGVTACEAMRDGDRTLSGAARETAPITEAEYRELRAVFEDSRHADLRDHGTRLVDLIWQMSQLPTGEGGPEMLAYLGPLTTHLTGLQSACADQGVIVNLNAGASAGPSAGPRPTCAEVFDPGRLIDEKVALAPCQDPDGKLKAVGNFVCVDGRYLFQVDASTGAPAGWGFGGRAYRETTDAATDPDYAAAYRDCTT